MSCWWNKINDSTIPRNKRIFTNVCRYYQLVDVMLHRYVMLRQGRNVANDDPLEFPQRIFRIQFLEDVSVNVQLIDENPYGSGGATWGSRAGRWRHLHLNLTLGPFTVHRVYVVERFLQLVQRRPCLAYTVQQQLENVRSKVAFTETQSSLPLKVSALRWFFSVLAACINPDRASDVVIRKGTAWYARGSLIWRL